MPTGQPSQLISERPCLSVIEATTRSQPHASRHTAFEAQSGRHTLRLQAKAGGSQAQDEPQCTQRYLDSNYFKSTFESFFFPNCSHGNCGRNKTPTSRMTPHREHNCGPDTAQSCDPPPSLITPNLSTSFHPHPTEPSDLSSTPSI